VSNRLLCSILSLMLGGLVGFASADEPFAVKVKLQYGSLGPVKEPVAVPGEFLTFGVAVEGLQTREEGEVECDLQAELRNEKNDLIQIIGNEHFELKRYLGKGKYRTVVVTQVPVDHEGGKLKLVLHLRDVQADQEIKTESLVTVKKKPIGVYLANAALARGQGKPSSGRFDVGEVIHVPYRLQGFESVKKANCVLALIPTGQSESIPDLQSPIRFAEGINPGLGHSGGFQFPGLESFEGIVRLTVTDDGNNKHSVELPLHILEPLRSESAISVAEKVKKVTEKPKKK
jgi:hypothetical protein